MKRDFRVYLDDILESIDRIEEYTKRKTKEYYRTLIKNKTVLNLVTGLSLLMRWQRR